MNCLAVWYKHKPSTAKEELEVELHLNLWKLKVKRGKKKRKHKQFLDIGIKIPDPRNVSKINIFIPFKVTKEEIEDLGYRFENNSKLVAAIFNEQYSVTTLTGSKTLKIMDSGNKIQFYIYMIDFKNDVKIRDNYGGSIISIKVKSDAKTKPIYYRIRITSEKLEGLGACDKPESQWLESHFTNTELIDFRVNEKRNLDKTLLEEIHGDGEVRFERVDLFIMREFKYDYIYSHEDRIRSRGLEKDLWGSYVGNDCECDNIIAYHWKWENEPGFNAFVKYKFVTSNKKTIITFILFLLGIAFFGGLLGAFLIDLIRMWCS